MNNKQFKYKKIIIICIILFALCYISLITFGIYKVLERNYSRDLINAIEENDIDRLSTLLKKSYSKDKKPNFLSIDITNNQPLIVACNLGNIEAVKMLIESGADPNVSGTNGISPLIISVTAPSKTRYDIIYYLIDNGANVNQKDFSGRTILNELIITNSVLDSDEYTLFEYLIGTNENLFFISPYGNILYEACMREDVNVVKYLCEKYQVNVNQKSNNGNTYIMYTVGRDNCDVFEYLFNYGADLSIKNDDGKTIYDLAKEYNATKILEYLDSKK